MVIKICYFTKKGENLARKISRKCLDGKLNYDIKDGHDAHEVTSFIPVCREKYEKLDEWTKEAFLKRQPIIFIGACGIAVRTIAPYVKDKLTDSAVIVVDEMAQHVIPVLSGHVGGANELAEAVAGCIGAVAVITTATDINHKFAVDLFAKRNRLYIENRDGIAKVSSKVLNGGKLTVTSSKLEDDGFIKINNCRVSCTDTVVVDGTILEVVPYRTKQADIVMDDKDASETDNTLLKLHYKKYVIGIGCKKGKTFEELKKFVEGMCVKYKINIQRDVAAIASIDLKKNETGLIELAQFYNIPFMVYSADELNAVSDISTENSFGESEFVKQITGVSNVCERACVCAAEGGKLFIAKQAFNGMTFAVASL